MKYLVFFIVAILSLFYAQTAFAIVDPLSVPNNKVGIHILFPDELPEAAKLINNGGDWGYVIIPIQSGDKDLEKWQKFMDTAKQVHVIPIIRLATEGDYFNTQVWRKPEEIDVLDFANFLNSLSWPTKNRYVVVFNEVNRGDEWGGNPNPSEYAQLLSYAVTVFKSKNSDFFIISSGFDNASANILGASMNEYDYMRTMNNAVPGIFNQIDGLGSHSYPNPAFSQPPSNIGQMSIASFRFQAALAESFSNKTLPVFITETGWDANKVSDAAAAQYYTEAFSSVWSDQSVVTVTPFLLKAGGGPFTQFSFIKPDGSYSQIYKSVAQLPKVKGEPVLQQAVLGARINRQILISSKQFPEKQITTTTNIPPAFKTSLKWFLKMPI